MSRHERTVKEIIFSGSPLANHSLNQSALKEELQGEERLFRKSKKEEKRERKKTVEIFKQFCFLRAVWKKNHGSATPEDLTFIEKSKTKYPEIYEETSKNGHQKPPTIDHYIALLKSELE